MADTTECRLEWWDRRTNSWFLAHAGVPLLHPRRYCERLSVGGKVARVTLLESGEVIQLQPTPEPEEVVSCDLCGDAHPLPHDGLCLV